MENIDSFAPIFEAEAWSDRDLWHLEPFVTNPDKSVYVLLIPFPELVGALCSRASRAAQDLRYIFLNEFLYPFLSPQRDETDTDETWQEKQRYQVALKKFISFLHRHGFLELLQNPKARAFYAKWLAQYGDDSIAQMAGTHLVFWGISQPAIKHLEDQRIGLAPIEKSTRYVDYSKKIKDQYLYYTDPTLKKLGLEQEYRSVMDNLFETYIHLLAKLQEFLKTRFPEEKLSVIRAKSFDVLRGLLPSSTLSQVAFFGNGQAFEYLINRCAKHPLGEVRWIAKRAYDELWKVTPSFLRRIETEIGKQYQTYLGERRHRAAILINEIFKGEFLPQKSETSISVKLVEYDPEGENKIIAGILFDAPGMHRSWGEILNVVRKMSSQEKQRILAKYLEGRKERWQKVGRALENAFVRFEIVMPLGAYRDLHRHRMHTQQRQYFSCHHGYEVPPEITEAGFGQEYRAAIEPVEDLFEKLEAHDSELAQYATCLAHRIRFQQWQNLRAFFWEAELRTIPEGHPDYRKIEQEKFKLLQKVYPLICQFAMVNMSQYDFARRGQDEKIAKKEKELKEQSTS